MTVVLYAQTDWKIDIKTTLFYISQILQRDQQNNALHREITGLHGELSLKTDESTHHMHTITNLERDCKEYQAQVVKKLKPLFKLKPWSTVHFYKLY